MLNKPEATPGPWEAIDGIIYPAAGVEDGRDWIADLRCASNENANAALIAAAPELLGALQWIDSIVSRDEGCDGDDLEAISEKARAAIRKAKGEKA